MNRDELVTEIADILATIDADTDKPLVAKEIRKPLAHQILSLIDGELDKAKKYDALFPLIKRIATISYNQVNGGEGLLTAREVWEWQAEAERILYGKVGGCRDALEGKEAKDAG